MRSHKPGNVDVHTSCPAGKACELPISDPPLIPLHTMSIHLGLEGLVHSVRHCHGDASHHGDENVALTMATACNKCGAVGEEGAAGLSPPGMRLLERRAVRCGD